MDHHAFRPVMRIPLALFSTAIIILIYWSTFVTYWIPLTLQLWRRSSGSDCFHRWRDRRSRTGRRWRRRSRATMMANIRRWRLVEFELTTKSFTDWLILPRSAPSADHFSEKRSSVRTDIFNIDRTNNWNNQSIQAFGSNASPHGCDARLKRQRLQLKKRKAWFSRLRDRWNALKMYRLSFRWYSLAIHIDIYIGTLVVAACYITYIDTWPRALVVLHTFANACFRQPNNLHANTHKHVHMYRGTPTDIYSHKLRHTHTHQYMHTHTHTHTHTYAHAS